MGLGANFGIGTGFQLGFELVPSFGHGGVAASFQSEGQRVEHVEALAVTGSAVEGGSDRGESFGRVQRRGAADGEVEEVRQTGCLGEQEGAFEIFGGERLSGIPEHQRQIVVGGIFGMVVQILQSFPAILHGQTLQCGSKIQAHDGRLVFASEPDKLSERGRRVLFVFAQKLNGPGADVFISVME